MVVGEVDFPPSLPVGSSPWWIAAQSRLYGTVLTGAARPAQADLRCRFWHEFCSVACPRNDVPPCRGARVYYFCCCCYVRCISAFPVFSRMLWLCLFLFLSPFWKYVKSGTLCRGWDGGLSAPGACNGTRLNSSRLPHPPGRGLFAREGASQVFLQQDTWKILGEIWWAARAHSITLYLVVIAPPAEVHPARGVRPRLGSIFVE